MGKKILSLFLLAALPGLTCAGEAKILSMSGNVEARQTREGQWGPAADNMEIAEGGAVRTASDGAAVLLLPNKTKIWLKETTSLEIEQRQTLASRLALVFGRIKLRVPHLMRKEKFEVRTPAAVCAVRGTEFTVSTNEEGKMDLQVLYGEVKLRFVIPPEKGADEYYIPQGQGLNLEEKGKPAKLALLTPKAEMEALGNWNPGVKPADRLNALKEKENDRAQAKEFARVITNSNNEVKSFLNVVKESDLEAGRTLTDVHGNLVRVDQRMMRPADNEIQFFNLVKRPVYSNDGSSLANGGFKYNGAQGVVNRLDYMQMTMAFNKDLPQRIEDWPGFFDANAVKPSWASFVMANRTDANEIFFIAQGYKYDAPRDMLVSNPWVLTLDGTQTPLAADNSNDRQILMTGVLKNDVPNNISAIEGLNKITNLQVVTDGTNSGAMKYTNADRTALDGGNVGVTAGDVVWAIKTDQSSSYSVPKDAPDNAPLAQFQADMYLIGNNAGSANLNDYFWFAKENYVIGNGGGIKTPGDFTNSSTDPFTLLKDSALESVMYIKKSGAVDSTAINDNITAKNAISDVDYFAYSHSGAGNGTNIDVVFIPDLMVAAVQRMLPAITNLKD